MSNSGSIHSATAGWRRRHVMTPISGGRSGRLSPDVKQPVNRRLRRDESHGGGPCGRRVARYELMAGVLRHGCIISRDTALGDAAYLRR